MKVSDRAAFGAAIAAYVAWGFFPLYWKLLQQVQAAEILCHRILWSCLFYGIFWFGFAKNRRRNFLPSARAVKICAVAGTLISINWLTYIYAVNSGHVLEGSLAYYINPLFNVLTGTLFFRERLTNWHKAAVGTAALGVLFMMLQGDHFPWLALVMAVTFSLYGSAKKLVGVEPFHGAFVETLLFVPLAFVAALYLRDQSQHVLTIKEWAFLIGGGAITGLPLVWFARGAQALPYSLMGMLQFISPSLQFLLAVFVFGEAFPPAFAVAFGLIWLGVALYLVGLKRRV